MTRPERRSLSAEQAAEPEDMGAGSEPNPAFLCKSSQPGQVPLTTENP
jgi:hypothetical protein